MPGRNSLFWRLVLLVAGFCLSMIAATDYAGRHIDRQTSYLSREARQTLKGYADEAALALAQGPAAVDRWLASMRQREPVWLVLVDEEWRPVAGRPLRQNLRELSFVRNYEGLMSRRSAGLPLISVPVGQDGAQLILRLPERFLPWRNRVLWLGLMLYLVPALLSIGFCALLYVMLISPLDRLRRQANSVQANQLDTLLPDSLKRRRDELGELGRSIEYLAWRLRDSIAQQRQLLRDLSHELRTPLSRLRVACESSLAGSDLRKRLEREIGGMQLLVENTLELAWLDSEPTRLPCEPIDIGALWEVLRDDACFESGWAPARIPAELPGDCRVQGNLNALAQALENVLRNAIAHSPPAGQVTLGARRQGGDWLLWVADQGPGVAEAELTAIFRPFTRLSAARPGGDGFGLGLAIAAGMVRRQGGAIWAENDHPGLRICMRLRSV